MTSRLPTCLLFLWVLISTVSVCAGQQPTSSKASFSEPFIPELSISESSIPEPSIPEPPIREPSIREQARRFFVIANLENTLAHEMGHVILDEFDIPVLGNIEAAADQLGVFLFSSLMGGNDNFIEAKLDILKAIADEMHLEWGALGEKERETYWSLHPFEPQRFYSMACMIYGSEPKALEHIREFAAIPYARAFYCRDEYETTAQGVSWVLSYAGRQTAFKDDPSTRRIQVIYEPAFSERTHKIRLWLEEAQVVENIVERAEELFVFPRKLQVSVANCPHPDALWMSGKGEIVLCYQLMERYYYLADHRASFQKEGEGAQGELLDIAAWNAFCAHEAVAEHYHSYCTRSSDDASKLEN